MNIINKNGFLMKYTKTVAAPPFNRRMVVVGYENTAAVGAYSTNFNALPSFTNSTTTFASINYSGGQGIAYGLGYFVTCGSAASATTTSIAYSTDGVAWSKVTNSGGLGTYFYRIAFGNGAFIAAGGTGLYRATSITDSSANWTRVVSLGSSRAITYIGGNTWMAGILSGIYVSVDNGVNWNTSGSNSGISQYRSIEYNNGVYIACGLQTNSTTLSNKIVRSTDGSNWELISNTNMYFGNIVKYNNGVWLCGGNNISNSVILFKSTDNGLTWIQVFVNDSNKMTSVNGIYSDGTRWYISGGGATGFRFAYSSDNDPFTIDDFTFVSSVSMTGDIAVSYT